MRRHFTALAAVLVLTFTGAATARSFAPVSTIVAGHHVLVYQMVKPTRRVILYHGLGQTASQFAVTPIDASLVDGLARAGYQVIVPDLPYHVDGGSIDDRVNPLVADIASDPGHGRRYVGESVTEFNALAAWAAAKYGPLPLVAAGISWGGFNALQAACHSSRKLAGFMALMPVVDLSKVYEFQTIDSTGANLNGCAKRLASMPGMVEFGYLDTRVGWLPTGTLAGQILTAGGRKLTVQPFMLGHDTTAATIAAAAAWAARLG